MVLFLAFVSETSAQCAMCKEIVEESDFGSGLNTGILYLMTVPYIILFLLFRKKIVSFMKELLSID